MAGKNEKEAADNFLAYLNETLSCVTDEPLTAFQQSKKLYKVWFNPPVELSTRSGGKLFLSFTQVLGAGPDPRMPDEFKVSTREYSYRLLRRSDVASNEILAYHWHPNDSALRDPHLHIRSVARVHFPTSRVCLEDFVRMHQILRSAIEDEEIRMDSYLRQKQKGFRANGYVEDSAPALEPVEIMLTAT